MVKELGAAGLVLSFAAAWLLFVIWRRSGRDDRAMVCCPGCLDYFEVQEWLEDEATAVGDDLLVCALCAKALLAREASRHVQEA